MRLVYENRWLDVANRSKHCWVMKVCTLKYESKTGLTVFESVNQDLCDRAFILYWKSLEKYYKVIPFCRELPLTSTSPAPTKISPNSLFMPPTHLFPINMLISKNCRIFRYEYPIESRMHRAFS